MLREAKAEDKLALWAAASPDCFIAARLRALIALYDWVE
jgi:hypothetical protein